VRIAAIALFAVAGFVAWFFVDTWRAVNLREWLFYDASYADLGGPWWSGAVRLALMAIALVLSVAFFALVPRGTYWWTHFGQYTMYVYLLHSSCCTRCARPASCATRSRPGCGCRPSSRARCSSPWPSRRSRCARSSALIEPRPAWMFADRTLAARRAGAAIRPARNAPGNATQHSARGAASAYRRDMSELNLPVLDLSQLDEGPDAAASFRAQLRAATHDVGFFYLTGTGVTPELEARLHRTARAFFELPEADKLAIENINSPSSVATPASAASARRARSTGASRSTSARSGASSPTRTHPTSPA
jgi:hypothetical protein